MVKVTLVSHGYTPRRERALLVGGSLKSRRKKVQEIGQFRSGEGTTSPTVGVGENKTQ